MRGVIMCEGKDVVDDDVPSPVFVRSDQSFLNPADLVTRTRTPITPVEYVLSQRFARERMQTKRLSPCCVTERRLFIALTSTSASLQVTTTLLTLAQTEKLMSDWQ